MRKQNEEKLLFNSLKLLSMFKAVSKNHKKNQFQRKKVSGHNDQYIVNTGGQYSIIEVH